MTNASPVASEPTPPLVMVDDDDWIDVSDSVQSMIDHLEYQSVDDEVAYVLDSRGRAFELVSTTDLRQTNRRLLSIGHASKARG
jgi:hypothetical protein